VLDAIASGALTIAEIRNGLPTTRALPPSAECIPPIVRRGPFDLRLRILPDALADLRSLGWFGAAGNCNDAAVADAIVGLVERALALRLRPY
jgi:hypothetical protein